MLTVEPGVILPATPVAASIMMAISCSPGLQGGLVDDHVGLQQGALPQLGDGDLAVGSRRGR